jgi:SAM-dependent methyltransferase
VRLSLTQPQRPSRRSVGDAAIGTHTLLIGELLCESVDLHAGERVLDVPCGSGSTALAAARRFCRVVGVDVAELLEPARRRAQAEGLEVAFLEGEAEDLPLPDGSFEVVLSAGDAISIPGQEGMVGELLRVCRPGGRIGMVAWTPDGYVGQLFAAIGRHLPWGTRERLRELLGPGVAITAPRRSFLWRFPSAERQVAFLASFHAPTAEALQALEPDRADALKAELLEAARRFDVSEDDTLVLRLDYLEAVVRKPVWL